MKRAIRSSIRAAEAARRCVERNRDGIALVRAGRAHHQLAHRHAGVLLRAVRLPAVGDLVLAAGRLPGVAVPRDRSAGRPSPPRCRPTPSTAGCGGRCGSWSRRCCWGGCSAAGSAPTARLHQFIGWLFNIRRNRHNIDVNAYRPIFQLKYFVLTDLPGAGGVRLAADRPARSDLPAGALVRRGASSRASTPRLPRGRSTSCASVARRAPTRGSSPAPGSWAFC